MRFFLRPGVRRLFRLPLRGPASIHADIDEELESLIAARVDDLVARGIAPADARSFAVLRLGTSFDLVRDQLHHSAELRERRMRLDEYFQDFLQDIRYAARGLVQRPAFTTVAILTLAIGIGATTAIFSAVNVLLLRPLPFARPNELMKVSLTVPPWNGRPGIDHMVWSYPKFKTFRDAQRVFAALSLYSGEQMTISSGDVERIRGEYVGATYFRTLGLGIPRGRDFDPSIDSAPGAPREAILSSALWQRRFNAEPSVVGRTIDLDGQPYSIIGVAPESFLGLTGQAQLFIPITSRSAYDLSEAYSHEFSLVARRASGVTVARAAAAVTLLGGRVSAAWPGSVAAGGKWGAAAEPLDAFRLAPIIKRSLLVLFGAVGLVLLIACVNVANLLLGRATARRREIAVRLAIGASRARLARLLLTESVLLAVAGAVASVIVAWLGVRALSVLNPVTVLRSKNPGGLGAVAFSDIRLDWTALLFALGVAVVVGLLFGMVPALGATRATLTDALKGTSGTMKRRRGAPSAATDRVLVMAEVALAVILLAGSGLMIRSLSNLLGVNPGFDSRNVLTARVTVPPGGIPRDSLSDFYTRLLGRLRALPGVVDASLSDCAPLSGGCASTLIQFAEHPDVDLAHSPDIATSWVTRTWFQTMHIALKQGRSFETTDRTGAPKVLLVNEAAARAFWPGENPVGKRVGIACCKFGLPDGGAEVIGVVGDVRQSPDSAAKPSVYMSDDQVPRPSMILFIRTSGNPAALGADVRRVTHDIAPRFPVYDMQTMAARAALATAQARFSAAVLALFAVTALSLAAVGIYGVMALAVAARTREIGIRIALGADRARVQRLVVREGVALVAAGAAIGLLGALLCTRVLQSSLFGLTASDPATYASIIVLLGAAAATASWIPARRASRVDPVIALRAE